jgi:surface polysaccharide O-acyltransferase-like enzyme
MTPQQFVQMNPLATVSWDVVDIYQSIAWIGVPLFIMLHGALLLKPGKNESIRLFFKKRWARIGLPFLFWGAIYFVWDFVVVGIPFSLNAIIEGILAGPYTHFWYMYVLVGLYLVTPILRVFLAQADRTIIKYFVLVWLLGVTIVPLVSSLTPFTLSGNIFTTGEFVGYFVLGTYLLTVRIQRRILVTFIILGYALTAFLTYLLTEVVGGSEMYLFQQYFSPTVILSSAMVFLLLLTIQPPSIQKERDSSIVSKLMRVIGANTLPLYLFHPILMESIRNGYLGFAINREIINPMFEIPLVTIITLFVSLGIILLLRKIPFLRRLIGSVGMHNY